MGAVVVKVGIAFSIWLSLVGSAWGALSSFHSLRDQTGPELASVWPPPPNASSTVDEGVDSIDHQSTLLSTAMSYLAYGSVPYVWGGNSIGDEATCASCAACIVKNKKRGVKKRHLKCADCRNCGLDCSHFVQKVFADAGMHFPFVTTTSMMKPSRKRPDLIQGLRFIGTDFRAARPGDLLVLRRHVVILVRRHADSTADVIHVSRAVRNSLIPKVGGIEFRRRVNLNRFYGGLRRILRHEKLMDLQPEKEHSPSQDFLNTLASDRPPSGA